MELKEYVLYENEVWLIVRRFTQDEKYKDHWLLQGTVRDDHGAFRMRFIPIRKCTPLDPALNILFERKNNG